MDARNYTPLDETSIRYEGWRIVVVCFLLATFGWGLGFYGQSVYVAELHRLHGWPTSLISSGTTFFYLIGALLVVFVSEAIKAIGPRNCLLVGVATMAAAAVLIGRVTEPWQLYVANALLAFGWAGTSLGMITNTLGLWFDRKRGMAISLALNGASFGGIIGVPLLVAAIGHFGFSGGMTASAVVMVVVMVPVILLSVSFLSPQQIRRLSLIVLAISLVEPVAQEVAGAVPVLCDGGVRRGSDIVKAVARGATACLAGRVHFYALGAGGERGVDHALDLLTADVRRTMALIGARTVPHITRDLVD